MRLLRLALTTLFFLLLAGTLPVKGQSAVEVSGVQVTYVFGNQITFSAQIRAHQPIQQGWLLFKSAGESRTHLAPLTISPDGQARYQHLIAQEALQPFAPIYFWYHLILANGETYTTPQYFFNYIDNRFPWQTLEDDLIRVHWYAGELDFGQAAFDVAHIGLQKVSTILPYQKSPPVEIYIYASAVDLQNVLSLGWPEWSSGLSILGTDIALVSIAPGPEAALEMERQIPHELAHVVLYQRAGPAYSKLPYWLREGIASLTELYPNPEYSAILAAAAHGDALLDLSTLCSSFPTDAGRAYLAYAEADSFTRYLYNTYGPNGLYTLVLSYADGLDCEQGARRAFGLTLTQLDRRWRQVALGANAIGAAGQNLLPYLIPLGFFLAIPLWGWSRTLHRRKLWTKP